MLIGNYTGHIADQPNQAQLQDGFTPSDCNAIDATSCISAGSVQCHLLCAGHPFLTIAMREPIDWDALFEHITTPT